MPVYNVEKYLPQCIDSILNQDYVDFELILVNDGSPDNSLSICCQYAEKDKRVRVINKPNGGSTSSRKAGAKVNTLFVWIATTILNRGILLVLQGR